MNKQNFFKLLLLIFLGMTGSKAMAFQDIRLNLTDGAFFTEEEMTATNPPSVSFGIAISPEGTQTRVAADDATANIVLSGKFHSTQHGWSNFSATVNVEGPVKISMGACAWGGDVTIKKADGTVVGTFNTNTGKCYSNDDNIVSGYYKENAPATLIISGGNYTPYFAVEAVVETPSEMAVTFGLGDTVAEGTLPENTTVEMGAEYTLPANRTLYVEGKTLTAWTDGESNYAPGQTVTAAAETLALTAVFTDNAVSLDDRKEDITLTWDFQRKNGAPTMAYQNKAGIYVTQATVNGQTIDVKADFDTNPGKLNNGNWTDWAQCNDGTTFTVPVCKNAVISYVPYSSNLINATTIAGQPNQDNSLVYAGSEATVDIVFSGVGYLRTITVTLPYADNTQERLLYSTGFTDWDALASSASPVNVTKTTVSSNEELTFTLQEIQVNPTGTNAKFGDAIGYAMAAKSASTYIELSPLRSITKVCFTHAATGSNRGYALYKKNSNDADWVLVSNSVANPASGALVEADINDENVALKFTNLTNNQNAYLLDLNIYGKVEVTTPQATLTTSVVPEGAGGIKQSPAGNEFDEGTQITLTAEANFGYRFSKWTDAAGNELSTEATYTFSLDESKDIKAEFVAVTTYSLTWNVEGGANDYMISATPDGETVNGQLMYEEGTEVTVTATNNSIAEFGYWKMGDNTLNGSEQKLVMNEDKVLTAFYSMKDYIVAWDFYKKGNNGRVADFHSTDENEVATLILRNADGATQGWLDKSQEAAGGYEGLPAAVNWKNLSDKYYFQTMIDATNFTDIVVNSKVLYNYNAYQVMKLEYSLDGETFTTVATVDLGTTTKVWKDVNAVLPATTNNQEKVYIRWYPDYSSAIVGSTSANDGTALAQIYILGKPKPFDDGMAPALESTVPAMNSTGASATGKIVLNFSEKVQMAEGATITFNGKKLTPVVAGATISFAYAGLDYDTEYTLDIAKSAIVDLFGNPMESDILLTFRTMLHPDVTKGEYNKVVSNTDELLAAITEANAYTTGRYRIFVKNGTYDLGEKVLTQISGSISLIGESMENTIIVNTTPAGKNDQGEDVEHIEGIGTTATFQLTGENIYMQDLTIKNAYPYGIDGFAGRAVVIQDRGTKNVFKNVKMLSYQDTYYTNNNSQRAYLEDCEIHGVVDFICGGGDIFFNRNLIYLEDRSGNVITAPAGNSAWGYVFSDCTIDGAASTSGTYYLGRPWQQEPRCVWLNTTMKKIPAAAGWTNMGPLPKLFAEYNSHTENGTAVDCSKRKKTYDVRSGDTTTPNVPYEGPTVLSDEQAAEYTIDNVLGGDDAWQPLLLTEQAPAPTNVLIDETTLSWDDSQYVFCWAICKNGNVVAFTTENSFTTDDPSATYSVRAANEMGGLGEAVTAQSAVDIETNKASEVIGTVYYNLQGMRVSGSYKGVLVKVDTLKDGRQVSTKVIR